MYKVYLSRSSTKQIRKRGEDFKKAVKNIGKQLGKDLSLVRAEKLNKPLNFVYSHHFSFSGTQYRLAFSIDKTEETVNIILVAPRENFYKKLRQIL